MRALVLETGLSFRRDYPIPDLEPECCRIRPLLSGVCRTDLELISGYHGFRGVLGHEFVGVVEAGPAPWPGRRVVGEINRACQSCDWCRAGGDDRHCPHRRALGIRGWDGAFADFLVMPAANLHIVPDSVSDLQAVFCEPLAAALAVREHVPPGQPVLGLGDGRLGLLVAHALRDLGPLTWVGKHEAKLSWLRAQGVDCRTLAELSGRWPVVIDCTGSPAGLQLALEHTLPRGRLIVKTTTAAPRSLDVNRLVVDEIHLVGSRCGRFGPALAALAAGGVRCEELISAVFPLEEGVPALEAAGRPGALKVLLRH